MGTKDAIENANVLLEYHLSHLKQVGVQRSSSHDHFDDDLSNPEHYQVEALRAEKLEIDQQLRTYQHSGQEGRVSLAIGYVIE